MITLQDIFDNLTYGDLSHVSVGGSAVGFVADKDYPKLVYCINSALTALHKRFLLRTGELTLQQYADINQYYLRTGYAVSNADSTLTPKYVIDTVDNPFTGNLFKVERVISPSGGALVLNDSLVSEDNPVYYKGEIIQTTPIYTPNFDTLFLTPTANELLKIEYRADHPKIVVTEDFNPATVELHISSAILDALSLNVAARIYSPLVTGEAQNSAASSFMYQYEMECKRLEDEGIPMNDNTFDNRFDQKGFV